MTAFGASVATALTVGTIVGWTVAGVVAAGVVFGGISLLSGSKRSNGLASSPTYASSTLQTQTSNKLPVPMVYGEVKMAGNLIYQKNFYGELVATVKLIAFSDGEIESYSDIRLSDLAYKKVPFTNTRKFYGTPTQEICTWVEGNNNAERAAVVGSLKNLAYLGIRTYNNNTKVDVNYNTTAIIKGRKIKVYTDEDTYTTVYNNNPVWCCLDLLTSYNGQRLGLNNLGVFDNNELKKKVDINSFIEAADYCDELLTYYKYQTNLTGNNNDLLWLVRNPNRLLTLTYVAGSTPAVPIS